EPRTEEEVPGRTVTRARAKCLACGAVLPPEAMRAQLSVQRSGADVVFDAQGCRAGGARILAVVTVQLHDQERQYRLPTERDYEAVRTVHDRLARILGRWEGGGKHDVCPVPHELLPPIGTLGFRVQRYGVVQWVDMFTARQKMVLLQL